LVKPTALLDSILGELGITVFEATQNSNAGPTFELLTASPSWGEALFGTAEPGPVPLTEYFPYLESFLPDAEALWTTGNDGSRNSGIWAEVDREGNQHHLEALAMVKDGQKLLVLLNLTRTFEERHNVYQRARELSLANEKLIIQLNQRQRELQDSIGRQISGHQKLEHLSEAIEDNTSAVLICKPYGAAEIMNRSFVDLYQVPDDDRLKSESMLDKWVREAESIYPEIQRVVDSGSYWEGEFRSYGEKGEKKWVRLMIGPVLDRQGSLAHFICIANDITELKKAGQEFENLTEFDFITHLPNRRHFWKQLTKLIDEAPDKDNLLALFYIDLDHFKRINDTLGHHAGDYVLNAIAFRLARCVKRGDLVAHLGGDEFALVLKLTQAPFDIGQIAQRVQAAVGKEIFIERDSLNVTSSVGIAIHPEDGREATSLMKHADLAMYHAKKSGRGQYQIFTPSLDYDFSQKLRLENDLKTALEQQQFRLVYQPQVCSREENSLRLEALIRWEHPTQGNIPPGKFIPLAEDTGLIIGIGVWVMETACRQAREFLDEGFDIVMAVNISARQIKQVKFLKQVESILETTGLPPRHLELEITESTLMEELDNVNELLQSLRAMGVSITLDDFGCGFSSLSYLKNLPVDNLKLDRSFIHELPFNEEDKTITTSVINLAHDLKMTVIAEGVETKEQLRFLDEKGCDYMQGFLFYYPMETVKIREVLGKLHEKGMGSRFTMEPEVVRREKNRPIH